MKILKTILFVACFELLLPTKTQAQEIKGDIMDLTEYTIKFGENSSFTDGVKKWKKCYKDNNGVGSWNVWHRLQGKGNIYVATNRFKNWAEMDQTDAAAKACRSIAMEFIIPHIESIEYNTTRYMPEFSRNEGLGDKTVVWVTSFKVNDSKSFKEAVKEMSSTISKKEGDSRGYWYRYMGGEAGDYFVSTPFKDFADLDTDREGIWELYEGVNGKSKTDALRQKFMDVIDEQWSYTYTLETELSMQKQ